MPCILHGAEKKISNIISSQVSGRAQLPGVIIYIVEHFGNYPISGGHTCTISRHPNILHLFYHIWPILWAGMKFNHFFHRLKTGLGVFKSTLTGAWLKLLWTHGGGAPHDLLYVKISTDERSRVTKGLKLGWIWIPVQFAHLLFLKASVGGRMWLKWGEEGRKFTTLRLRRPHARSWRASLPITLS